MFGDAQRVVAAVESDKLRLEEDVSEDHQGRGGGLETCKASYKKKKG